MFKFFRNCPILENIELLLTAFNIHLQKLEQENQNFSNETDGCTQLRAQIEK